MIFTINVFGKIKWGAIIVGPSETDPTDGYWEPRIDLSDKITSKQLQELMHKITFWLKSVRDDSPAIQAREKQAILDFLQKLDFDIKDFCVYEEKGRSDGKTKFTFQEERKELSLSYEDHLYFSCFWFRGNQFDFIIHDKDYLIELVRINKRGDKIDLTLKETGAEEEKQYLHAYAGACLFTLRVAPY